MTAIRILIVEDSPTARLLLRGMIDSQSDLEVVGEATNGTRAVEMACDLKPDLVVMDVHMPGMTGIEATTEIMRRSPRPIIVVSSSLNVREHPAAFDALSAGALMVLDKPSGLDATKMGPATREFTDVLRALAKVRVLTKHARRRAPSSARMLRAGAPRRTSNDTVVAIGASTGGPIALQAILSVLPRNFPKPVLVTQHITPGFNASFAAWLGQQTVLDVRLAHNGDLLEPGAVYVAPENCHLGVSRDRTVELKHDPPYRGQRPSVNRMFASLAENFGVSTIAVQLTGMGDDGAEGSEAITVAGGQVVIEDPATAVISSMPESASLRCPGARVLPVGDIGAVLCELTGCRPLESASAAASASASSASLPTARVIRRAARQEAGDSAGRRAIVVDDSRTFRLLLTDAIGRAGFEVIEADSAISARQMIRSEGAPDLLVVDWQMPGLSGVEFVRELRENADYQAMRIMMVTSIADQDHIKLAQGAGVDAYVTKPFSDTDIDDALLRLA